MGVNSKATGSFYSEEAARLALEAAKRPRHPAATATHPEPAPPYIPAVMLSEPQRPPLAPQPAINQNRPAPAQQRPEFDDEDEDDRRPLSLARLLGWIILLPWYVAMLAGAVGIIALFAKDFFHL